MERKGFSPDAAQTAVRSNNTVIAALAVHLGDADCMLCGSCSYVCPSNIPLSQMFSLAKAALAKLGKIGFLGQNPGVPPVFEVTAVTNASAGQLVPTPSQSSGAPG